MVFVAMCIYVFVDGFRSFNDTTNKRVTSGHFSLLLVLPVKASQRPNEKEISRGRLWRDLLLLHHSSFILAAQRPAVSNCLGFKHKVDRV